MLRSKRARTRMEPILWLRCACQGWRGKGTPGKAGGLRLGGRRGTADFLPVLGLVARRRTHFACFAALRSNRRRQVSSRSALRARATSPVLLSASEAPSDLPGRAFAETLVVFVGKDNTMVLSERALALRGQPSTVTAWQAVPGRGDFWGGEEHSAWVGARSALRKLTRGRCLNGASAASIVSSTARPMREHRSAVGVPADCPSMSPCRVSPAEPRNRRECVGN